MLPQTSRGRISRAHPQPPSSHILNTLLQSLQSLILTRSQRARQVVLRRNPLNTMRRVDILNHGDLVASRRALAGDDGAVGEEVFPYLFHSR